MKKIIVTVIAGICLINQLIAQEDIIRITKTFEPTISDAKKPDFRPQIIDTVHIQPSFSYKIIPFQLQTTFSPEPIHPAKLMPEVVHPGYGNYVKLGFGSNISPLADIRLNGKLAKNWQWGVNAYHKSSFANFEKNGLEYYPNFHDSKFNLGLRRYLKKHLLSIQSGVEYYGAPFYGFDFDAVVPTHFAKENLIHQHFILQENHVKLKSTAHSSNHFHSSYEIEHYSLWDKGNASETEIDLHWELEGEVFELPLEIETSGEYIHFAAFDTTNRFLFELKPAIFKEKEDWKFKLGFNFYAEIDPEENTEVFIYPEIEFDFALAEDFMHSYFGLNGNFESARLRRLVMENPFFMTTAPIHARRIPIHVYAGFKGLITNDLKYNLQAGYQQIKNQHFYQSALQADNTHQFIALYDSTDLFRANAELSYTFKKKVQVGLLAKYEHYFSMTNEDYAWLIPAFSGGIYADYNFQNKINVRTEFQILGERKAKLPSLSSAYEILMLPVAYDWNLELEYKYNRKVSGFLAFENLLGNKYYLYNYYPVEGFRSYLGVIYSF